MSQLLSNLLGNALTYGDPATRITVRGQGDDAGIRMEVHNWGPPIDADSLPLLFAPMQRGIGAKPARGQNVGLGLYIVKQICLGHGGDISVRSTAEEGTSFLVHLPRQQGE